MSLAQQQAAEKAVEERDRLYRRYRAAKKAELQQLFAIPVHGDLLRKFNATIGHFDIDDANRMVDYVRQRARTWLHAAPDDVRVGALQMIGYRIMRIRQRAGLLPFDDPLPDEQDDVFRLCKAELGL